MNRIIKYIAFFGVILLACVSQGCSEDALDAGSSKNGTLLNLYASTTGASTRLAELGDVSNINDLVDGKNHIGLYVYYQDDYDANDLSKPYIRNLECKVSGGKIVPVNDSNIYIYDRMTIVAFYPYNANVHDFTVKADETEYPITESDYVNQTYIPYKASTTVNPTNAFMTTLSFSPQQTFKIQLVLVADNESDFPQSTNWTDGSIKLLPNIDPREDNYTDGIDRRELWVDKYEPLFPSPTFSGKYVRRYTAYIWKSPALAGAKHHDGYAHENNKIEKGDILFQSNELTLMVPEKIDFAKHPVYRQVYRYGYNMNTGEIFIPTSDNLVYDASTLQGAGSAYQVCDIDLSGISWTPKSYYSGVYDGGGHAIKNLLINRTPTTNNSDGMGNQGFGLFGSIVGNAVLKNINLVSPTMAIDFTNTALTDTCSVGALCGIVNPTLPTARIRDIVAANVPSDIPTSVKEALIQDLMKDYTNTTSTIQGCKVENPQLTVSGENVIVGGICGSAGNQRQKATIKDSYVSQTLSSSVGLVINNNSTAYKNAYASGFCGSLNAGSITNSYSTLTDVKGYKSVTTVTPPSTTVQEIGTGFCSINPSANLPSGTATSVNGCYTKKDDASSGVSDFDLTWPSNWPLYNGGTLIGTDGWPTWPKLTWNDSWAKMGQSPSTYPTLIWEYPFYLENK